MKSCALARRAASSTSSSVASFLAMRMFSRVNGNPCANVDLQSGDVFVSTTIVDLRVEDQTLFALCDWIEPDENRPFEMTNETVISGGLLDVGEHWWLDLYFDWFLVFDPDLVSLALSGIHDWVSDFITTANRNRTVSRPPPSMRDDSFPGRFSEMQYYG